MSEQPCGYKAHETFWYSRPDGTRSCDRCHPHGEAAILAIEWMRTHPQPRYHRVPPYEAEKTKRKRKQDRDDGMDYEDPPNW